MSNQVKETIKEVFNDLANALETGELGEKIKIGLTINGSELGYDVMKQAAYTVKDKGLFDVVTIGTAQDWTADFEHYEATTEEEVEAKLDELLADQTIQGSVTLHHPFPVGVATVGRIVTPALGKPMYIATTTGTTATVRTEAMVLNTINGIVAAKAAGVENPTVGILNVDGANTVERALRKLNENGYPINFGESQRSDGGTVLRGNDVLMGAVDVLVTDSLTGNILMKIFGAYTSGGNYEVSGSGYGPGIGDGFKENICIVSRASGAPVIAGALEYAYEVAKGGLADVSKREYDLAKHAGLNEIRESLQPKAPAAEEEVKMPEKEIVTAQINGIDVLDLEEAVKALWKEGIYAESGMGCAGPIVLVSDANLDKSTDIVKEKGFL